MTTGTAKVARIPCWRSISRNAASPLVGAEQRLGRREVGGGDALRPRGDAHIDGDRDAAAGAVRPSDLGVCEAPLVGDRITLLPRHCRPPLFRARPRAADSGRYGSAPPVRSWGTIRQTESSFG